MSSRIEHENYWETLMIRTIPFKFPGISGVRCLFTVRGPGMDGNLSLEVGEAEESVRRRRGELRGRFMWPGWAELRQAHGTRIVFEPGTEGFFGPEQDGDGLATRQRGLPLVVKTADCQALLMTDGSGSHVGALHCGWRGNRANFPGRGVAEFCGRYGLEPENVHVIRGPSLGPDHSEFVGFEKEWGPGFAAYYREADKTMDLWRLTRDQLLGAGVPEYQIYGLDICTFESMDLFFSYRREKQCGRQTALIWMEK
ncbi:MAG: laccase domain-containing protein [Deltaproteobacteria bacterium]|nr:laccase domain-containing protein [Deltaproteobacteria bacterium]